jgi:2'-5' RNA ligase
VRLFVAIDVPDGIRDAIESEIVDQLRDRVQGARWTRPEGRHLTLKFLGNVDDERVGPIGEVLRETASRHASFEAVFAELGGFPNLRRPRVLWIGIGEGAEPMSALARNVESDLEPLGFEPEGRPFQGHLTLARFKEPRVIDVPEVAVQLNRFSVNEIALLQSRLHPKGARYSVVDEFALSG